MRLCRTLGDLKLAECVHAVAMALIMEQQTDGLEVDWKGAGG
jgi:hypothetical protein